MKKIEEKDKEGNTKKEVLEKTENEMEGERTASIILGSIWAFVFIVLFLVISELVKFKICGC